MQMGTELLQLVISNMVCVVEMRGHYSYTYSIDMEIVSGGLLKSNSQSSLYQLLSQTPKITNMRICYYIDKL